MLDTLKFELDQAVLVGTDNRTVSVSKKWILTMAEIELWYAEMILQAEKQDLILNYVMTFFEDRPVAFYLDEAELSMLDLTDTEKSFLN